MSQEQVQKALRYYYNHEKSIILLVQNHNFGIEPEPNELETPNHWMKSHWVWFIKNYLH